MCIFFFFFFFEGGGRGLPIGAIEKKQKDLDVLLWYNKKNRA